CPSGLVQVANVAETFNLGVELRRPCVGASSTSPSVPRATPVFHKTADWKSAASPEAKFGLTHLSWQDFPSWSGSRPLVSTGSRVFVKRVASPVPLGKSAQVRLDENGWAHQSRTFWLVKPAHTDV